MICIIALVIGIGLGAGSIALLNLACQKRMRRRAFQKGWGWYNPESGKFEWTDEDAQYIFTGFYNTNPISQDEAIEVFSITGQKIKSLVDTGVLRRKIKNNIEEKNN